MLDEINQIGKNPNDYRKHIKKSTFSVIIYLSAICIARQELLYNYLIDRRENILN